MRVSNKSMRHLKSVLNNFPSKTRPNWCRTWQINIFINYLMGSTSPPSSRYRRLVSSVRVSLKFLKSFWLDFIFYCCTCRIGLSNISKVHSFILNIIQIKTTKHYYRCKHSIYLYIMPILALCNRFFVYYCSNDTSHPKIFYEAHLFIVS